MNSPADIIRLARPHQWVKNAFVFTGLLFGHAWDDAVLVRQVIEAALAFCLISSAGYIVNDIRDAPLDRQHPRKKFRPMAAGKVSSGTALTLSGFLCAAGLILGWHAATGVLIVLLAYCLLATGYSFYFKGVVVLDVFVVSSLFMLRILAGTVGVGIPPSRWLLLCGLMVTLFLGLAKRRAEMPAFEGKTEGGAEGGSRYSGLFIDKMITIAATGSIMSYSLYTMSPETRIAQGTGDLIYTVPFVVYGFFRYIFLLHNGMAGEDPSRDIFRDQQLFLTVAGWLLTLLLLVR